MKQNIFYTWRTKLYIIVVLFSLLLPPLAAQTNCDEATLIALIEQHKELRKYQMARSTLEYAVEGLHEAASEECTDYHAINDSLRAYMKALDAINLTLEGIGLYTNCIKTYNITTESIEEYFSIMEDFVQNLTALQPSDTIIFQQQRQVIYELKSELESIQKSFLLLGSYFGIGDYNLKLTVNNLNLILGGINDALDKIQFTMRNAVRNLRRYLVVRKQLRAAMFRQRPARAIIISRAVERWENNALESIR